MLGLLWNGRGEEDWGKPTWQHREAKGPAVHGPLQTRSFRVIGLAPHGCFEVAFELNQVIGADQAMVRRSGNVPCEP
jgi:hypothetical protein